MDYRAKGYILSVFSALVCASTFIAIKYSLQYMDTVVFTVIWFGSAAFYSVMLSAVRGDPRLLMIPRGYALKVLAAGACGAIAVIPTFIAIKLLDPTVAALFGRMEMMFLLVMGVVFLKERFNSLEGVGLGVATVGILVTNWESQPIVWAGFAWMALACISMATQSVVTKTCVEKVGPETMTFYRSLSVVVTMLVYLTLIGRLSDLVNLHTGAAVYAVIGSFMGPFLGTILYYGSMKYLDVTKTTAVAQVTPLFVAILSFFILHELPGVREMIGGAILVGGLVVMAMGTRAK